MQHFHRRCRPTPGICLVILAVVLILTGFALPRAQTAPNPPPWTIA